MNTESSSQTETPKPEYMPASQTTIRNMLELITEKSKYFLPDFSVTKRLQLENPEDGVLGVASVKARTADPTRIAQIQRGTWLDERHKDLRMANYFINTTDTGLSLTLVNTRLEIDGISVPDEQNPEQNVPVSEATAIELLEMIQNAR